MLDLAAGFLGIAQMAQAAFGGPFHAGQVIDPAVVVEDAGGAIISSSVPARRNCLVQIAAATESMRASAGYVDGDVKFIILSASLTGGMTPDAKVEVLTGATTPADFVGAWMVSQIELDSVAIGYAGSGRKL